MVEAMYPLAVDIHYLRSDDESLYEKILYCFTMLPYIVDMKFSTVDDDGRKAFVVEESRKSYSSAGDDAEYTKQKTFYDKDTMVVYKQTKVKPDGTEKLQREYEVGLNSVTDEEISIPDLTGYRQILEN